MSHFSKLEITKRQLLMQHDPLKTVASRHTQVVDVFLSEERKSSLIHYFFHSRDSRQCNFGAQFGDLRIYLVWWSTSRKKQSLEVEYKRGITIFRDTRNMEPCYSSDQPTPLHDSPFQPSIGILSHFLSATITQLCTESLEVQDQVETNAVGPLASCHQILGRSEDVRAFYKGSSVVTTCREVGVNQILYCSP